MVVSASCSPRYAAAGGRAWPRRERAPLLSRRLLLLLMRAATAAGRWWLCVVARGAPAPARY